MQADVNIVETVAHMMCGGALLRRRRRHLRHRRAGHQGPVHEERRHRELPPLELSARPATACCCRRWPTQFGVPVTEYADVAFEAELAPKFSYGCAVFLDTDRVNFQKEGYSKEELLAGLAQVLPKNVWQYVVQIPRLAALGHEVRAPGRHAVQPGGRQGAGRLHQGARARTPRCSSTRTPARPARSARRWRRCASSSAAGTRRSSASMRRSTSSTRRRTTRRRAVTSARTTARARSSTRKTPDGAHRALHLRLLLREGHRRDRRRRCSRSSTSARRSRSSSRTWSTTSRSRPSGTSTTRRRCPKRRTPIDDVEVEEGLLRRQAACESTRPFQRSSARGVGSAPPHAHRHPARAQHLLDGAVLPDVLRGARHPEAERRLHRRDDRGDVGRGRQVRLDRSVLPVARSRRRTSTTCSSTTTPTKKPLKYIFFPILTHVPTFVERHDGQRVVSDRRRRARRHEGGVHQGGRLLRARAASSTSIRRSRSPSRRCSRSSMFETLGPAPRHHRGRERLRLPRGAGRRSTSFDARPAGQGPRDPRDGRGRRTASRSSMIGRPYHSDPGLNHGIPEEFQVLGYPILSIRSIPKDREVARPLLQGGHRGGARSRRRSSCSDVWPENYSANSAQKVWAAKFAAHHPNVVVLDLSSLQVRPRRADLRPHRLDHRGERRRRTRRCTTSTRTSRAARSRSASRPTRTRSSSTRSGSRTSAKQQATSSQHRIDEKRLELLELKRQQLDGAQAAGPGARAA